jgi:hypothetical protein
MILRTRARFFEIRDTLQHPLYALRKTKGTGKPKILEPFFDFEGPDRDPVGEDLQIGSASDLVRSRKRSSTPAGNIERFAGTLRQTQGVFAPVGDSVVL